MINIINMGVFAMKKRRKKIFKFKLALFLCLTSTIFLFVFALYSIDRQLMPTVLATIDIQLKNKLNSAINKAVQEVIKEEKINAADFYIKTQDSDAKITSISVNTLLVNDICSKIAEEVSAEFMSISSDEVKVPLGSLVGVSAFSNAGPTFGVLVQPVGNVVVDYNTSFQSVGINQINFQVWLNVDSSIRVVIPMQEAEINVNRKVSLVNTVFSGQVPNVLLNQ